MPCFINFRGKDNFMTKMTLYGQNAFVLWSFVPLFLCEILPVIHLISRCVVREGVSCSSLFDG